MVPFDDFLIMWERSTLLEWSNDFMGGHYEDTTTWPLKLEVTFVKMLDTILDVA